MPRYSETIRSYTGDLLNESKLKFKITTPKGKAYKRKKTIKEKSPLFSTKRIKSKDVINTNSAKKR